MHYVQKLTRERRWDTMEIIEIPTTEGKIDPQYLISRLEEESKKRGSFFDLYCKQSLPLAYLAINEGGLLGAIGRIANEDAGFIRFSSGNAPEMLLQKTVASKIIAGDPFYIDGTSALMLSESGFLEIISKYIPGFIVPQSVIAFLYAVKERFEIRPGHTGFMGYIKGKLNISPVDHDLSLSLRDKIERGIKFLESDPIRIKMISNVNKSTCFSEQRVPPELCDACILGQNENAIVLTEDFLYLQANEIETGKKKPDYCSSFFLVRILYEQKKITSDQYINYFSFLSSYRFRFLPISIEDIEKAIFGDSSIAVVRPDRIRLLNFPLTLSPEYGVQPDMAFILIGRFLMRVLSDDSITIEIAVQIYTEILYAFPTEMNKTALGNLLLNTISKILENRPGRILVRTRAQEKLERLYQITAVYSGKGPLLT
jgi:hypothetical protein